MKQLIVGVLFVLGLPTWLAAQETSKTPSSQEKTSEAIPLLRGEVQDINGDKISLNVGSEEGVRPGMIFSVYGDDHVYRLPLSKEPLIKEGQVIGRVRVVQVAPRFSRCEALEPFKVQIGQLVLGRPVQERGNRAPTLESVTWDQQRVTWGRPVSLKVTGSDPEGQRLKIKGACKVGEFVEISDLQLHWYPPRQPGLVTLDIGISDGIASENRSLNLNVVAPYLPRHNQPGLILGEGRYPFEKVDQLVLSPRGDIWILDRERPALYALTANLHLKTTLNLEGIRPRKLSVSGSRLALLDSRTSRVVLFDYGGKPLLRLGSEGDEIHEWEEATDILLLNDNTLAVLDSQRKTVVLYDANDNFIGCVGHPGDRPPGLVEPIGLERHGKGFAILDKTQHHRVIFDQNFRYQKTLPLGERTLPLGGQAESLPVFWPPGFNLVEAHDLSRFGPEEWMARNASGKRLHLWGNSKGSHRELLLDTQRISRLVGGRDGSVLAVMNDPPELIRLNREGWSQKQNTPSGLGTLASIFDGPTTLFLDSDNQKIISGDLTFGQKGRGQGMTQKARDILRWQNRIVVLDQGNEKILLFNGDGTLQGERPVSGLLSFCLDGTRLMMLSKRGQLLIWDSPTTEPKNVNINPGALGIRDLKDKDGFLILLEDSIEILDAKFKVVQSLAIKDVKDVLQSSSGAIWALTRNNIQIFHSEF